MVIVVGSGAPVTRAMEKQRDSEVGSLRRRAMKEEGRSCKFSVFVRPMRMSVASMGCVV